MYEEAEFRRSYNFMPFNRLPEVIPPTDRRRPEENDLTLIYDTDVVPLEYTGEQQAFVNSPWTAHDGFYPLQWLLSSELQLYFAGSDGYVYRFGEGETDDGEKIKDYLVTKAFDLGEPDRKKRLRWIDIDAESMPGSFVRIYYQADDGQWKLLCELEQGNFKYPFVKFPKPRFRKLALRFESAYKGCRYKINGVTLDLVARGQQREVM